MINNYRDHAANQRTFLAWVRTSVAIMAFGFIIERYDLLAAMMPAAPVAAMPGGMFTHLAGLALIAFSTLMMALASVRFLRTWKSIESNDTHAANPLSLDLALGLAMVVFGTALFCYLSYSFVVKG